MTVNTTHDGREGRELTFEELQNTIGGSGKDFGSMNMDELLKSIWTAKETQIMAPSGGGSNMLQRQQTLGEMTLEEFLVKAGVVREEAQLAPKPANNGAGFFFFFFFFQIQLDIDLGPKVFDVFSVIAVAHGASSSGLQVTAAVHTWLPPKTRTKAVLSIAPRLELGLVVR
ncbi:hypothetical protein PRUPE_5G033700 [Prunus persica]|uniref:Uncharacterized protein n=1 Tax=Prunus persica TaxID=3760 RepID=A0A251P6J6_PRUPE|nr:hypothetical protein PRUPE_5G033700 [Prunus persica]